MSKYISAKELADILSLDVQVVYRKIRNKPDEMPKPYKLSNGVVRFNLDEVQKWLKTKRV